MTTTTTKELRDNLADIRRRVMSGETIEVIYRSRPVMRLMPIADQATRYSGRQAGKRLDAIIGSLPDDISPTMRDPNRTYKQLRNELYGKDPKYQGYINKKPQI